MKTIIIIVVVIVLIPALYLLMSSLQKTDEIPGVQVKELPTDPLKEGKKISMPDSKTYQLDLSKSVLNWSAGKVVGNPHDGSVSIKEGSLVRENSQFIGGEFVIDMETIIEESGNANFIAHIRSDDFFGVEQFPTANLVLTSFKNISATSKYMVEADLTIRDKTNKISFEATIAESEPLTVEASFDIDRTLWGVVFDSGSIFTQLGDKAIKDEISFNLNLSFIK